MAALNFPPSPSTNQIYTANGKSWRFDGTSWKTYYILNVQSGGTGNTFYNLGDILVGAGTSLYPLPVGSNNFVLTADNTASFGITWKPTAATGITTLNSLTATQQYFSVGTSGNVFSISSSGSTHTFNIPIAGTGSTGLVSTLNQSFAGIKTFTNDLIISSSTVSTSTSTGALTVTGGVGIGGSLFLTSSVPSNLSGVVVNNGVITSGSWAGNTITAYYGGTGYNSYSKGDILVGAGNTFIKLSVGSDNYVLTASSSSASGLVWSPTAATGITTLNGLNVGIQYLSFGYSGTVPAFSSSGSTHTLNIPLAGSGSTGLISTQAQTIAGQKTFTSAIIGDLTGTATTAGFASTANYAYQAGYGITSGFATTASYAYQAGYGLTSGFATTAANINVNNAISGSAHPIHFSPTATGSGVAVSSNTTISFNPSTNILSASGLAITSSTSSTSATSGALIVTGGVGIGGSLFLTNLVPSSLSGIVVNNGVITSGSWAGSSITAYYGGTGYNSYTRGDILVGSGNTFIKLGVGADNYVLTADTASPGGLKWTSVAGLSITSINGLTASAQFFSAGSSGTGFNISSSGSTHTFNIPIAGTGATGLVSTLAQSFAGIKTFTNDVIISSTTGSTAFNTGALTVYGGLGVSGQLSFNQASLGYTGASNPTMSFIGSTNSSPITLTVLSDNSLLWEGSSGKLFGINNNLSSGWIFNVGDISGLPIIRANADGTIAMAEFAANVGIGLTNPSYKLHVVGDTNLSSGYVYRINGVSVLSGTSLGTGVTNSYLTAVGTISTGVWSATAITAYYGGTGYNSYTKGDILVGSGNTFIKLGVGPDNYVLTASTSSASGLTWSPTAATGVTTVNSLTASVQYFSTGASGSGFNISSSGSTHTFNIPIAGIASTGLVSTLSQSFAGIKTFTNDLIISSSTVSTSTSTGALTISGGVGIGGSLFLSSSVPSNLSGVVVNNGVITSGSWAGSIITSFYGGTGFQTYSTGDLIVGAGSTLTKVAVGSNNSILVADSTAPGGIKWASAAGIAITNINGLTASKQDLAFGYTGTVPAFSSSGSTHTLNIPLAGTGATGLVSTQAQSFAGIKTFTNAVNITDSTGSGSYTAGALVVTGGVGIGGTLNVQGDLNVQGTFTTINSTTITVADKNIELGVVASPSDLTAEGGGITLRGATNKSINWYSGVGWSSSESFNLSSGNTFKISGTNVLSSTTLGTGVIFSSIQTAGIITSGTWSATAITALYGGTGLVPSFTVGDILYANTSNTWGRLTANSNSGYVLTSAGSGATPVYVAPSTLSVGLATTATYAHQSGYAITSGTATNANNLNTVAALANSTHYILFSPTNGGSGVAVSSDAGLLFNPASNTLTTNTFSAGVSVNTVTASVSGSTASTSPYSGALVVTGGVGIGGSLYVASATAISGVTINNGVITGNLTGTASNATTSGFATTSANINVANAISGTFFPVLSNTSSSTSGIGASVNGFFSFNAATGAFGATSVNILSGQSYSIGVNSVLSATSLGTGVTNSSLTALGTISTGVWSATAITAYYGGTGYNSYAIGDLLVGAGSTLYKLPVGTNAYVLTADSTAPGGVKWSVAASTGVTTINALTASIQYFSTGTSGSGFNIASSGSTHTFNIPIAGTGATGLVTTLAQSFAGIKTFTNDTIISSSTVSTSTSTGALTITGGVGIGGSLFTGTSTADSISGVVLNNGVITSGSWAGSLITAYFGGTGYNSYTKGDILVGAGSTFIKFSAGTNNYVLGVSTTSATGLTWRTAASATATTSSAPLYPLSGDFWYDTTDGSLSVYYNDGDTSQWVEVAGAFTGNVYYGSANSIPYYNVSGIGITGSPSFQNVGTGISILYTTPSTSTTSGALTVSGGVGIGGSLYTGTSTADSISGVVLNNGVITSGTWAATAVTARYGGTGYTGYTLGDILVGAGSTFIQLPVGINGYILGVDSARPSGLGWTSVSALTVSVTAPSSPKNADLWFNSYDGSLLVYYQDIDTSQWVEIALGSGVDLTQPVHITNNTASTSTSTGALIVNGGVGIQGTLHTSSLVINGTYDVIAIDITLSTTSAGQVIDILDASVYRSVKYMVQITHGTDYQVQEIMLLHDAVDTYLTQYAQLLSGNNLVLATYDADLSGGNMRLLVTPTYTNTTFKIYGTAVRV